MTNPNPATTPTCPKWCDGAHEDPSLHRAILWADELDENPIAVSLFNADEALGYEAAAGAAFVSSVQRTCKVLPAHRRLPMTINGFNGHELVALGNVRTRLVDHAGALAYELVSADEAELQDNAPEVWLTVDMARQIAALLEQVTR